MIRQIGILMIAFGAAAMGFGAVARLRGRVYDLEQLILAFEMMIRELDYRLAPMPELLDSACSITSGHAEVFFRMCANAMEHPNGRSFGDLWSQTLEIGQLKLDKNDLVLIEQLGSVLGRYDGDNQKLALKRTVEQLRQQHKQSMEQSERLGKVYGVLGLTAGAFVLILFH